MSRRKGPLESAIESRVDSYAKQHLGAMTRKMNGLGFAGWPDRLFLLPGCPELWIEFKRPGEPLSELQAEIQKMLKLQRREVWTEDDAALCISKLNAWYVMKTANQDQHIKDHQRDFGGTDDKATSHPARVEDPVRDAPRSAGRARAGRRGLHRRVRGGR